MISPTVAFSKSRIFNSSSRCSSSLMCASDHGLKVNAVETEYDATVHGILGNLRGGFGDMIAFRHVMRGHMF